MHRSISSAEVEEDEEEQGREESGDGGGAVGNVVGVGGGEVSDGTTAMSGICGTEVGKIALSLI